MLRVTLTFLVIIIYVINRRDMAFYFFHLICEQKKLGTFYKSCQLQNRHQNGTLKHSDFKFSYDNIFMIYLSYSFHFWNIDSFDNKVQYFKQTISITSSKI